MMKRSQSFVKRHHIAMTLAVAALLVVFPARYTGSTRLQLFAYDIDVPVSALMIAMLGAGIVIGFLLARRKGRTG